jgi:hypothetical protein
MEPKDDPLDVRTKSGSDAGAVGMVGPSLSGVGWSAGSEKWTASMDGMSTDGLSANYSGSSTMQVLAPVEACTWGDRSSDVEHYCLGSIAHIGAWVCRWARPYD